MVTIDPARCTGCGLCAENCAVHAIVPNEEDRKSTRLNSSHIH